MMTKDLACQTPTSTLSFIEVPTVSQPPVSDPETEIELERADGTRLRLRSGNATLSLAALVRAFLEAH